MALALEPRKYGPPRRGLMKAAVFHAAGKFGVEEKLVPHPGFGEAVIQVRLATICGSDLRIVRGEHPVESGLVLGHEAVGVIHELGPGVAGYRIGQRVLVGTVTPCGQCEDCLSGRTSQCSGALGGWRLGNTMDGVQAEYARVPFAQANLAVIPENLADEEVLLLSDVASAGFAAAESGGVRLGDNVAVFAQGPVGLCATLGAKLMGAARIIAIDSDPKRLRLAQQFGATTVLPPQADYLREIHALTGGQGVDVAIEALGKQETFENALRSLRPGGTLSSVGMYCSQIHIPPDAFASGLGGHRIVTTLCPGGKARLYRLMRLVETRRIDLRPLLTHVFPLEEIHRAYEMFQYHAGGALKIAIRVS